MRPRRFVFPKGLRGVALLLGITVVLSTGLTTLRARSPTTAWRSELVLYVVCLALATAALVQRVRPSSRRASSVQSAGSAGRSNVYRLASFVVLFSMVVVRLLWPQWWASPTGTVFEWVAGLSGLWLLLLATQPHEPSSSGPQNGSPE